LNKFFKGLLVCLLLFSASSWVNAQTETVTVKGLVTNAFTGELVDGVNVVYEDDKTVGVLVSHGRFQLDVQSTPPFFLIFSGIGYQERRVQVTINNFQNLQVTLVESTTQLDDVSVLGESNEGKGADLILSAFSPDKLTLADLKHSANLNLYDGLSTLKAVDLTTQSYLVKTVNTRGFNTTANTRFTQVVDGIDNQAPGLNFSIGNLAGLTDLDVESMVVIPGAQSAQYGSGTFNGVLQINSKSPFEYPGVAVQYKAASLGLQKAPLGGYGSNGLANEVAFRYAHAFNDRFAFKVSTTYVKADDFLSNNYNDVNGGDSDLDDNPSYSGVNVYGDETGVFLFTVIPGEFKYTPIFRTGYKEEDLAINKVENLKANASFHFKPSDSEEVIVGLNHGLADAMITGDNRIALRGFSILQGKAEYQGRKLSLKGYFTKQNSGESFDLGLLAKQINLYAKDNASWFRHYESVYKYGTIFVDSLDHNQAREFADSGIGRSEWKNRPEANSDEFNTLKASIVNDAGPSGARIVDNSAMYNLSAAYKETGLFSNAVVNFGVNFRQYLPESKGTIFPDTLGNDISLYEASLYSTFDKEFTDGLRLHGALRVDKNENYPIFVNPIVAILKDLNAETNLRLSIQRAVRFPSLREQFQNQDLGGRVILGGLDPIIDGNEIRGNSFTISSIYSFNRAVEADLERFDQGTADYRLTLAELNNLDILKAGIITKNELNEIRPEKVISLEGGFKSFLWKRLFIDVGGYYNGYTDFIGIYRLVRVQTSPLIDLVQASKQVNNDSQSREYYVAGNSKESVRTFGLEFNSEYTHRLFIAKFNATYNRLITNTSSDITPAFNTPELKMNFVFGQNSVLKNFGYRFNVRYREGFMWESAFLDGMLPTYTALDFQVNWRLPKLNSDIKLGANNLTGTRYTNHFGGPTVDRIWFISYTFNTSSN
jgi:outer membrane receptor protein involved in Fe transport